MKTTIAVEERREEKTLVPWHVDECRCEEEIGAISSASALRGSAATVAGRGLRQLNTADA